MSIVRWIHFTHDGSPPPFIATAAVATLFKLSGLVNVVLYMLTRPNLLLFRGQASSRGHSRPSASQSAIRHEDPQRVTEEIFELEEIPISGSPYVYSANTYGSSAAMQLPSPTPHTNPEDFGHPRQQFMPLAINIPSPRLSNLSNVWERVHKEALLARSRQTWSRCAATTTCCYLHRRSPLTNQVMSLYSEKRR